ncbi:MAG: ATP-dependent zinc metalloprotease FtsH [Acidobacteriota bacterium]
MNQQLRNLLLWALIFVVVAISIGLLRKATLKETELPFSRFDSLVQAGQVKSALVKGSVVRGELKDPVDGSTNYVTNLPPDLQNYTPVLVAKGVDVRAAEPNTSQYLFALFYILPVVLIIGFWIFFMRQMQQGGNKAFSFGKSKARMVSEPKNKVTFKDVAGIEEVKEELFEIIDFLKDPQKFQKLGGKIPKGVLLMGAPGTGKTLLAKAIAGEAGVPFFSISGSEFVELFVGVGASRVRDLFEQAKKNAPCIVFIDEIDAVGRNRGVGSMGGHEEREQTLNQLLVEMDGFEANEGVIIVAATNRPDVLDQALLRPGRFDRRIVVPRPDLRGREEILGVHVRPLKLGPDVVLSILARGTPGFSGADLANLANEAALRAARRGAKTVDMEDFEFAKDKVLMGTERRSMILSEADKKVVATHEAGHAVVAYHLPNADPIHKVSIVPRGMALGVTQQLPMDDKYNYSREYLEAEIAVMLGGRTAEEIFIGSVTTGAGNDFEKATEMAWKMVTAWGMSEKLGPLAYRGERTSIAAYWDAPTWGQYSADTAREIDEEVKRIVIEAKETAERILNEHKEAMGAVISALLDREVLDKEEFEALLRGETLPAAHASSPSPQAGEGLANPAADAPPASPKIPSPAPQLGGA